MVALGGVLLYRTTTFVVSKCAFAEKQKASSDCQATCYRKLSLRTRTIGPAIYFLHIFFFHLEILASKGGGQMEVFSCKTKIISGLGAMEALAQLQSKRLLLVADPYFEKTPLPEAVKTAAKAAV